MTTFRGLCGSRSEALGITNAGTPGVTITANASANVKGSYATIGTPTFDYNAITLIMRGAGTGNPMRFLADLALGATPDVVADNLLFHHDRNNEASVYCLPLFCPSGVAIKARIQASTGSETMSATLIGHSIGPTWTRGASMIVACGADTANTAGTQMDPGGTANTLGTYATLSSGLNQDAFAYLLAISKRDVVNTDVSWICNIGLGATPDVIGQIPLYVDNANDTPDPKVYGPVMQSIPRAVAIKSAVQCSITTATERLIETILYGCIR